MCVRLALKITWIWDTFWSVVIVWLKSWLTMLGHRRPFPFPPLMGSRCCVPTCRICLVVVANGNAGMCTEGYRDERGRRMRQGNHEWMDEQKPLAWQLSEILGKKSELLALRPKLHNEIIAMMKKQQSFCES